MRSRSRSKQVRTGSGSLGGRPSTGAGGQGGPGGQIALLAGLTLFPLEWEGRLDAGRAVGVGGADGAGVAGHRLGPAPLPFGEHLILLDQAATVLTACDKNEHVLAAISYHPLVHVHIGPLSISPHGIGIAVGFLLGARLMLPTSRRKGITEEDVYGLLTRAAIGAIIGARVAYVVNHLGDYSNPIEALEVWKGGISFLGGFLGAIALALPEMRKLRLSFWKVMDSAAPGMALGVIVGRIGDLIVADHLGKPTSFFLGSSARRSTWRRLACSATEPTGPAPDRAPGSVVHQTALYDLILSLILLGVPARRGGSVVASGAGRGTTDS